MKSKFLLTLLAGAALSASAQGFKDGVEYYRADQPEEAAIIINNNLNEAESTRPRPITSWARSLSRTATRQKPATTSTKAWE